VFNSSPRYEYAWGVDLQFHVLKNEVSRKWKQYKVSTGQQTGWDSDPVSTL